MRKATSILSLLIFVFSLQACFAVEDETDDVIVADRINQKPISINF